MNFLKLKAFAKINLFLHVLGRDEKGYHLLDSLFVFADVGDDLTLKKTSDESIKFTTSGEFKKDIPENEDNLVIKTAKAFDIHGNLEISLKKNLPVSAGIGGGSADAGALIRGLKEMFHLNLTDTELIAKGAKIGADIPACIFSSSSIIAGIGEKITPFPLKDKYYILLINPLKKILTKDIFKIGVKHFSKKALIDPDNLISSLKETKNDLLDPALILVPEIKEIITSLKNLDGVLFANMSGSGATCFALFNDSEKLLKAKKTLKEMYQNYWIESGKLI